MSKVSVIIPVYGVEKYIERCVRSLFEQTLSDMEFIFVDDCTKDKSIDIIECILNEYPDRIPQTRILHHTVNRGLPQARATGVQVAAGDYLIYCDSDDFVDKNMYEVMLHKALQENADVVFCNYNLYYDTSHSVHYDRKIPSSNNLDLLIELLKGHNYINPVWGALVKSSLAKKIIFPSGNQGEDSAIMAQIIFKAKKLSFIQNYLYYYFINDNSINHSIDLHSVQKRIAQSTDNLNLIIKFLKEQGLYNKYRKYIIGYKFHIREFLWPLVKDGLSLNLWNKVFPEISLIIYFSPYLSIKQKMRQLIVDLRLTVLLSFILKQ